jgi:hypothetical protein
MTIRLTVPLMVGYITESRQPLYAPLDNFHISTRFTAEQDSVKGGLHDILEQRFLNFFQVETTFISQNVLRTALLLNVLSIC